MQRADAGITIAAGEEAGLTRVPCHEGEISFEPFDSSGSPGLERRRRELRVVATFAVADENAAELRAVVDASFEDDRERAALHRAGRRAAESRVPKERERDTVVAPGIGTIDGAMRRRA